MRSSVTAAVALALLLTLPKASHAQRATLDRYPSDAVHHVVRDIAVTYSADDVGATIRFGGQKDQNGLGYPDKNLFELHNRFPKLQMTMVAVTENRYLGGAHILNDFAGMAVWKRMCDRGPTLEWMDMGFHGRFHAPPTDSNIDHHEFDPVQPADHDASWDHRIALTPEYNVEAVGLWRAARHRAPARAHAHRALARHVRRERRRHARRVRHDASAGRPRARVSLRVIAA